METNWLYRLIVVVIGLLSLAIVIFGLMVLFLGEDLLFGFGSFTFALIMFFGGKALLNYIYFGKFLK